jgi:hypothetical protein
VVLAICTITRPHDIGQDLLIDLHALRVLGTREFSFSPCVHVELSLPVVDPALFMCMVNVLCVDGAGLLGRKAEASLVGHWRPVAVELMPLLLAITKTSLASQ